MRIPLLDKLLRRIERGRVGVDVDLAQWEEEHRKTIAGELERVWRYLPEELVFVDVGANLGLFAEALLAARPRAHGYLFEPVQALHELCARRFAGDERITLENFALAHEPGQATIYKARYNPGGNSLVHELMYDRRAVSEVKQNPDHRSESVRLEVFDRYARDRGLLHADFIKTDTEGFDYRVLQGMLGFIAACEPRPVILAELMSREYHPFWDDQLEVIQRLYELGYQEVDLSQMGKVQDILFVPQGR
jgi:FkbM family methyltransferase